jgi:hypothetical protein
MDTSNGLYGLGLSVNITLSVGFVAVILSITIPPPMKNVDKDVVLKLIVMTVPLY